MPDPQSMRWWKTSRLLLLTTVNHSSSLNYLSCENRVRSVLCVNKVSNVKLVSFYSGTMFNTLGRSRNRKDDDVQRTATLGRYDNAPRYHDERAPPPPPQRQPRHFEDDPRNRETAFPPRDVYFDKVTR